MAAADARTAALALHEWLLGAHWRGDALVGPDAGVRINYRVGRFVKSYLAGAPWRDDMYYLQGQGYWILANWRLHDLTGDPRGADLALRCARGVVARQRADGSWNYPNPEWRGRVANAEGSWAAIGLVETARRTGDSEVLAGARRWHRFLIERIGFRRSRGGLAANYFSDVQGAPVPNTTAFVLRLLAELADATGEAAFLDPAPELVRFLGAVQLSGGEMPYQVPEADDRARFTHFQCPQYNAFQCLDLLRYRELTGDDEVDGVLTGLLAFLRSRVDPAGRVPYSCERMRPQVSYHGAAVAAALAEGAGTGGPATAAASARALNRVLALQRPHGSFPHSRGDYGVLRDIRSYPRHLAMLLLHLLLLTEVTSTSGVRS